ncbi:MAG: URC4/urg3 family protein [Bdellovibrionota bacterium]
MSKQVSLSDTQIDYILSPTAIRDQSKKVFDFTVAGDGYFAFNEDKMQPTVDYVLQVIRKNYPDLNIPFHSRWGHFRVGGTDRAKQFETMTDKMELARTKLDLVITSVLLDAGAGAAWKYFEDSSQKSFNRSEGLGVASLYMFKSGVMCSDKKSWKADAQGLQSVTAAELEKHFQVTADNPLVGVQGRVQLLNNLGKACARNPVFKKDHRPGNIIDHLAEKYGNKIPATAVLRAVLDGLGEIWPGRISAGNVNLGDVWQHSKLDLVPIHKLSQWMTYSLLEPIMDAGFEVSTVEGLTGLAEYRNGGLLIDSGLLTMKDQANLAKAWTPDSDLIIEWRSLTIYLLDQIGAAIQKSLNKSPQDFPLAKILEGGTWWAGRFLAQEKRAGGNPPLNIQSDGTVF